MIPKDSKPARPEQPPLSKSIPATYQRPVATELFDDEVVVAWKELNAPGYVRPVKFDPHPDTETYPNHRVDTVIPSEDGGKVKITYVVNRDPLVSYRSTSEGLVDQVTVSRIRDDDPRPELSALIVGADQKNLANGEAELTIVEEPEVFSGVEFSTEVRDPVPAKFQDFCPLVTKAATEAGEAQLPVLGPGEFGRSSRQTTRFRKRDSVTARDLTQLPATVIDKKLGGIQAKGSEHGGEMDIVQKLAVGDQDLQSGFDIVASKVEKLPGGLSLRETERLANAQGAYLELTNGGSGFSTPPAVLFSGGGVGNGASATALFAPLPEDDGGSQELTFVFNGDDKGVFYFLGKRGGHGTWRNPHTAGDIVITADGPVVGELAGLVDRQPSNTYTDDGLSRAYYFDLKLDQSLYCKHVSFRQRSNFNSGNTYFQLQGTNTVGDPTPNWTALANVTNVPRGMNEWVSCPVPNGTLTSAAYRRFRIITNLPWFTIGEVELYGTLVTAPLIGDTGSVISATVVDGGADYIEAPDVVFVGGGGTGAAGTAVVEDGEVVSIAITNGGLGYTSNPDVLLLVPGGGGGAAATATLTATAVTSIAVTNGGSEYGSAPVVQIVGDGVGATATATVVAGEVTLVTVTAGGSGYTTPPTVVFIPAGGPVGQAILGFGVASIAVGAGGSGYDVAPPVHLDGDGQDADAYAVIGRGLDSVVVTSPGLYSSTPTATISGGGGSGATLLVNRSFGLASVTIVSNGSGYTSDPVITAPAVVDDPAVFRAIRGLPLLKVEVSNGGEGYTSAPTVDPNGANGTGAVGTAVLGFGVDTIAVTADGTGYLSAPSVEIRNTDGQGNGAQAVAELLGRTVASILVDNGGVGYTSAPTIIIGDGTGATAHAVLTGAVVTSIVVDTPGGGYSAAPVIYIGSDGGGSGAHAVAVLSAANTLRITVTNPGLGYESAPDVIFTQGGGTGAAATATLLAAGVVKRVTLSALGSGFRDNTPVIFSGGGGTGAVATSVRNTAAAGPIAQVIISHAGTGYAVNQSLVITGGGGSGAVLTGVLASSGGIRSIQVTAIGSGYTSTPLIVISTGSGSGGAARAVLKPTGAVKSITVANAGRGYSVAPTVSFGSSIGSGATATASLLSTGSIIALILVTPGGPFTVAPLVSFLPTGSSPIATALYILPQAWPTLVDIVTDPTDQIVVKLTKDIVPYRSSLVVTGFADLFALDRYRSIQIVSRIDMTRLPMPDAYLTTRHISLPAQLLSVGPIWDQSTSQGTSSNPRNFAGSVNASASVHGTILVLKKGGFQGAALARVVRTFFNGAPPSASVPQPTIIRPSSGTAFIVGRSRSGSQAGTTFTPPLNIHGQPAQIGDIIGYGADGLPSIYIGGGSPLVEDSAASSIGSTTQAIDINNVLTAGIVAATDYSAGQYVGQGGLFINLLTTGRFSANIPASCPAEITAGTIILEEVDVEKWRFNLFVRTIVYVIAPGDCLPAVGS